MGWLLFWLLVLVVIMGFAFSRGCNHNYRFGSGLYKSSEDNLDEKDEWVVTGVSDEQTYFNLEYEFVRYERLQ